MTGLSSYLLGGGSIAVLACFGLPVAADEALTAFYHPYAYAAARGVAC